MKKKFLLVAALMLIFSTGAKSSVFDVNELTIVSEHPSPEAEYKKEITQLNPCAKNSYTPVNSEAMRQMQNNNIQLEQNSNNNISPVPLASSHKTVIDTQNEIKEEIAKLNGRFNDLNSNFRNEINKLNSKLESMKTCTQNTGAAANLPTVEKSKKQELPFRLSKEMEKTFTNSSTRGLNEIPEKN